MGVLFSGLVMRTLLFVFCLFSSSIPTFAAELKLDAVAITAVLADKTFRQTLPSTSRVITQTFQKAGVTHYVVDGQVQLGFWRVTGDQYCSNWPPTDNWACFDLMQDGEQVVFVSSQGARTVMVPQTP